MSDSHTHATLRTRLTDRLSDTGAIRTLIAGSRRPRAAVLRVLRGVRPAGWLVAAGGVGGLVTGVMLQWQELTTIGGALLGTLIAALGFIIGRHPYEVTLELSDRRVVAGDQAMAGVTVNNRRLRPALPSRVEVPVGGSEISYRLPALAKNGHHEEVFTIPTSRRGVLPVGPVHTVRGDPLGLMRRAIAWGQAHELYVHPATVRLASSAAGFIHDLEGRPSHHLTSADLSFHALREYVPGDDRRYVHWRTTARTGTLMVRQFEESRRSHVVIALSRDPVDYEDPAEFEIAISAAGSIALEALREDKDLTAITSHESLPVASRGHVLDALTRLEWGRRGDGLISLARKLSDVGDQASLIVLLGGAGMSVAQLRTAGAVLPTSARILAVQAVREATTDVSAVGAVTVVRVSQLADLRRAFARAVRR